MASSSPLFSVIVPVYNGERTLAATLQSVFALGYEPMEVVVVDDGSTDGTAGVAKAFGDTLRYIHQENAGPAAARNRGLNEARGEVVGFLDADDCWTPAVVQNALPALLAGNDIDIVQGRIQEVGGSHDALKPSGPPYAYLNLGSAVFRRGVFDQVGPFDDTMRRCEDYDWFLRAYDRRVRKLRIDEVMLLYRRHAGSLTHGRTIHEIDMTRAHKKAAERRRRQPDLVRPPTGFPSLVEYIGARPAASKAPAAPARPEEVLQRLDQRPIDLPETAIPCFMVVRNEAARLPTCMDYYRRLGVSRFFIVDNDSDDGTPDWLLAQPDVHVWHTAASFGAARCGTDWTESLLRAHGQGRWCLVVDADELLVYPGSETRPLSDLCAELDRAGLRALMAIMVDMYSDRPIRETNTRPGEAFLDACPYFDRQVYHDRVERFYDHDEHTSYFGGVRRRVFGGQEPGKDERFFYCLNKTPLLKYDASFVLADNLHWTNCRETAEAAGCLLHFKFLSGFVSQAASEARRKEHWNGAVQYARYDAVLGQRPDLTLYDPALSVRFQDSRQLQELGMLRAVTAKTSSTMTESNMQPAGSSTAAGAAPAGNAAMMRQVRELIRSQKSTASQPHADGLALLKAGDLSGAEIALRHAIAESPGFSWTHHYVGDVLMMKRQWPEAITAYRQAIDLNPHFAGSHFNLGECYTRLEEWEDAAASFRQALTLQPELPNAARNLARALKGQALTLEREAQHWYRRAHALRPDDPNIYSEAIDLRPIDPDLCLQFGDALAARSDQVRAIFFYQLALQVRPDDARACLRLAAVLRQEGDLDSAIACCRQAVLLEPEQPGHHRQLGGLLVAQDRTDEAIAAYRRSLELKPEQPDLYKDLGDLLAQAGRVDEAAAAYAQAVTLGFQAY